MFQTYCMIKKFSALLCLCMYIYICTLIHPVIVVHPYYETRALCASGPSLDKERNTPVCTLAGSVTPGIWRAVFVPLGIFCYTWALVCVARVVQKLFTSKKKRGFISDFIHLKLRITSMKAKCKWHQEDQKLPLKVSHPFESEQLPNCSKKLS